MSEERYSQATSALSNLKAALTEVNQFVYTNQNSIREVTGIPPPGVYEGPPNIYTTSLSQALILQIYLDTLGRNLGEPESDKLPA